jgi:hypothetical protein
MAGMDKQHDKHMGWARFAGMIAVSTAAMFFLMYQLVYSFDHAYFSINRLVASLAMACVMAVVMLAFMWPMYANAALKTGILAVASLGAIALVYVNRSQALIDDVTFMKSMIPHHSIAINNASKAKISDPRVRRLADQIIEAQVEEIRAMNLLLESIGREGEQGGPPLPARSTVLTPEMDAKARETIR